MHARRTGRSQIENHCCVAQRLEILFPYLGLVRLAIGEKTFFNDGKDVPADVLQLLFDLRFVLADEPEFVGL